MFKNQKGITFIELLAALALLSIVLILAGSVQMFGQTQWNNQNSEIQNQENVRLAMDIITKEIRKASSVSAVNNLLIINQTDTYQLSNNTIMKNGQPLISDIQQFTITPDNVSNPSIPPTFFKVTIEALQVNNIPQSPLSTTIYLRN